MPLKSVLDPDPDMPFSGESLRKGRLEPDFTPEYDAWKLRPGQDTNAALLKKVSPVIDTAMTTYGLGQSASPTLRSKAKLMALKAMTSYDPSKGNLRTHLLSNLRGLQRASAQEQQIISLPERVAIQQKQLIEMEDNLRDQLGRDPSDGEIADATGLSHKRLAYIRRAHSGIAEGSITSETAEGDVFTPASRSLGPQNDAWMDFVYYDLGPTDQLIMDYTMGRNGTPQLPTSEIARRLGVTPSAVSQRAARIQAMLDEQHDRMGG